ncbi:hypothetical protein [Streptomyces sp. NPDC001275]
MHQGSSTLMKLLLERADVETLAELMDDVMWDQWVRTGGMAPASRLGEAAITLSAVQYLLVPGWAKTSTATRTAWTACWPHPLHRHQTAARCEALRPHLPAAGAGGRGPRS